MTEGRREAIRARYRTMRELSMQHQTAAVHKLSASAIREQGRKLGLIVGKELITDNMDEVSLIFDLLLYTAPPGRSRGIDRYASSTTTLAGSDDELVIEALRNARFSLWSVKEKRDDAGVVLHDLLRDDYAWFMDEAFERHVPLGTVLAMRVSQPESFVMHCGVMIPLDAIFLEWVLEEVGPLYGEPDDVANGRRLATAVYKLAVAEELLEGVEFQSMA